MLDLLRFGSVDGKDGRRRTGILTPYDANVPFRDAGRFDVVCEDSSAHYHASPPPKDGPWGTVAGPPLEAMPAEHARLFRLLATRWVFAAYDEMTVYWPLEQPSVEYSPWGIFPSREAYTAWERGKVRGEIWNLEDDDPLPEGLHVAAEWRGPLRAGTRYVVVSSFGVSVATLLRGRAVRCRSCDKTTGRHLLADKYVESSERDIRRPGRREALEAYLAMTGLDWATIMRREGIPVPDGTVL